MRKLKPFIVDQLHTQAFVSYQWAFPRKPNRTSYWHIQSRQCAKNGGKLIGKMMGTISQLEDTSNNLKSAG